MKKSRDTQVRRYEMTHLVLFSLCAFLGAVFVLRVLLSSFVYLLYLMFICCEHMCICCTLMCIYCTMCVLLFLLQMPDRCLEVSNRKVLRPATSTQVFLGFPVSTSEW